VLDAKTEVRLVLDRLADGTASTAVDRYVSGYIDDALGDLVYALEEELREESIAAVRASTAAFAPAEMIAAFRVRT